MCGKKCMSKKEACGCVNSFHRRSKKDGSRGKWWTNKIPNRSYWCDECNSYHVTSLKYYNEDFKSRRKPLSDRY